MNVFHELLAAASAIATFDNVVAMVLGTIAGILVGALPGITAAMSIAILLPFTFTMDPIVALGMIAGIYNGAMYGGAIPAILLRIPGTPAAVATTFDGYPLAQEGKAGLALQVSSYSSAIGGMASAVALIFLAPPLAVVALSFGPPEMFWVGVFGLASIALLLGDKPYKGLLSVGVGLLLAMVGTDKVSGHERFVFGRIELVSGLDIAVVLIGLFALPPAMAMAEAATRRGATSGVPVIKGAMSLWRALGTFRVTWLRASLIGIVVGILPGAGGNVAAILAYNETKRNAPDRSTFGKGNTQGLAAAECANNADNAAAMIPALTLGVPGTIVAALILGALMIQGMQPGPQLFRERPDVVYGFMLQMLLTSVLIIPLGGLLASRIFARLLLIPPTLLMPLIVATTVIGVYSINNSTFDIVVLFGAGILGWLFEKLDIPLAPAALGLILGPMIEANLRISLLLSRGDPLIFVTRPVSLAIIGALLAVLAIPFLARLLRRGRRSTKDAA
ncbi:tripartite tricarboxylate transporter permease [Acuticoccus kandeliae]|uniref:tripartite tricarboxylate transporter permease n=1 Tax=Acuticoccus kandeliae TaxID=2073160 RepID=UPI000D3E6642|nr:tripartite tricarboxylate transporter permease [Acuticoccus kandeliae]